MRAITLTALLIPLAAVVLLGCSRSAEASVSSLHYRPANGYIGDVHPVYFNGRYYLPHLTADKNRSLLFVSQLLVSDDLIHWEEVPISVSGLVAKDPGKSGNEAWRPVPIPKPPEDGSESWNDRTLRESMEGIVRETVPRFWLVTVMDDPNSDRLLAFYPYGGMRMLSSVDMTNWELYLQNPVLTDNSGRFSEFRDPNVFWNDEAEEYWMVLTTSILGEPPRSAGAISYARSKDLVSWTFEGPLYYPGNVGSPECPEMFKLGDFWYLVAGFKTVTGTVGPTEYVVSESPTGPWRKPAVSLIAGTDHIVGNSLFDGKRRISFGWIPTYAGDELLRRAEWGGDLALPREIYPGPDGTLYSRLPEEFDDLGGEEMFPGNAGLVGNAIPDGGGLIPKAGAARTGPDSLAVPAPHSYGRAQVPGTYDRFDFHAEIALSESAIGSGIVLTAPGGAVNENRRPGIELGVDLAQQRLVLRRHGDRMNVLAWQPIDLAPGEHVSLRIIVEEDILEAFLDDRFSLAARLPEVIDGHELSVFGEGGVTISKIRVYWLPPGPESKG